ncbi:MAG: forkhead-associated protein [Bacteriovoracaceae bacterium]|nr:forkhead-associated protein [Bacteriovoracaceae bacterium]
MPIKAFLTVTEGASKGSARDFAQGSITIGRGKVDLILFDKKVSNQHCVLSIVGEECWLEDLKSTNGTFVSGKRVDGKVQLHNLDEIIIGLSKISVALVEQMAEFKKANIKQQAPEPAPENSQVATRQTKSTTGDGTGMEYRETGVRRIDDLIQDEMATFSQWDHPQMADEENESIVVPKIKIQISKKAGPEGMANFICTKPVSTIGRKNVDIKLSDLDCSRLHAQIEIVGGTRAFIKDLASTNGTFVNGKRITTQEMESGDKIQIGQTIYEVTIESESS